MSNKAVAFVEQLQADDPLIASDCGELLNLYNRKLWHQLTLKLEQCFNSSSFNRDDIPVRLYNEFISDFGHKINLLKLAQLAVHASKYYPDPQQAITFLQSVVAKLAEWKDPRGKEPMLFLNMHIAQLQLETGGVQECKALIEEGREQLEVLSEVDPCVSAAVYYVSSLYYKWKKDYAEFYKSSLMYLAFVSSDSLAYDFKLPLAVDIALAALLGDQVYNFAQILTHPIVKVLHHGPYEWLYELLECFHAGDLHSYDELCQRHATVLNAQPALVANERRLREKILISCLMGLISRLPAEERRIPLSTIGDKTKLDIDGVEFLLMKALSLHLIEGKIDQVSGIVQVSWVQPRIMTLPQVEGLKGKLDTWIGKVGAICATLEQNGVALADGL